MGRKPIYPVTCHTDHVGPGTTFVVIKGFHSNGTRYIESALKKGAIQIVVDQELGKDFITLIGLYGARLKCVPNARQALARMSAQASGYAHKKLKLIGITGTKGKTSVANILFHLLHAGGVKAGLISTTGNALGSQRFSPDLTTPQPDYLHHFFQKAVEKDIEWIVMEVAAQAVSLHRIDGLQFDLLLMTNIGREHLEFYNSMDEYIDAKKALLNFRKSNAPAWINGDDEVLRKCKERNLHWFGLTKKYELNGSLLSSKDLSLAADIQFNGETFSITCPTLMGAYNLSNILAAIAGALRVGLPLKKVQEAITTLPGIPGRLECYRLSNGAMAIIDYAHNPLSYNALFSSIRSHTNHLIIVFGAGGDRDKGRRPEMGAIASQYGDVLILTTDNPRSEDPKKIIEDIISGIPTHCMSMQTQIIIEPDRKKAIKKAYALSKRGSILALLGKGPDEYQLLGQKKIRFSEREILKEL